MYLGLLPKFQGDETAEKNQKENCTFAVQLQFTVRNMRMLYSLFSVTSITPVCLRASNSDSEGSALQLNNVFVTFISSIISRLLLLVKEDSVVQVVLTSLKIGNLLWLTAWERGGGVEIHPPP